MSRATPRFRPEVLPLEDRTALSGYFSYAQNGSLFNYHVDGMPDFDQRRAASGSVAGLPNDGAMYCAPTAAVNVMAFLANHGHPELMPFCGARNWQAAANYGSATAMLTFMGDQMNTDPVTGTSRPNGAAGLQSWLDLLSPGEFTSGFVTTKGTSLSCVDAMKEVAGTGVLVMPAIGWYAPLPGLTGYYYRTGGHIVTLASAVGTAGLMQPKVIGLNDPDWEMSSTKTNQSAFTTNTYPVTTQFGNIDGTWQFIDRVNGRAANAFLEGYYFVDPNAGVHVTSYDTASSGGAAVPPAGRPAADFAPAAAKAEATPARAAAATGAVPRAEEAAPRRAAEVGPAEDFGGVYAGVAVDAKDGLWFTADPGIGTDGR